MSTRTVKENEGRWLMRVWVFLITASYLSRLSAVSCGLWAASSQTRQWHPNLMFPPQKAFSLQPDWDPCRRCHCLPPPPPAHFTGQANCRIRQNEDWRVFKSQWHMTPIMSRWRLKGIGDDIILRVLRRTFSAGRVPSAYTAETGGEPSGWLCQQVLYLFIFCF